MKITFISDTHLSHDTLTIEPTDVLVHCGDFTGNDTKEEWGNFIGWLAAQPAKHTVLIEGNHDNLEGLVEPGEYMTGSSIHFLRDSSVEIEGLKFFGTPWMPNFYDWHWMLEPNSEAMIAKRELIPLDTNVLITHCPPFGVLDETNKDKAGCEVLFDKLQQMTELKTHAFGHIHEGYGIIDNRSFMPTKPVFVNACIMNEKYRPVNKPWSIEL